MSRRRCGTLASLTIVFVSCAFSLELIGAAFVLQNQAKPQLGRLSTDDPGLRKLATHAPAPVYPPTSLAKKSAGVAVVLVSIAVSGRTEAVSVLEAPDDAIGKAVQDAVMQWTFRPMGSGITGNLVFYFTINKVRQGIVSSPQEMQALKSANAKEPDPAAEAPVKDMDEAAFNRLTGELRPVVLDIRDRSAFRQGHREGALSIPVKEVLTRAVAELPRSKHIVIDCFPEEFKGGFCAVAAHFLTSSGFRQVSMLKR